MRIGIVAPEFPPDIGGAETYSYQFTRELARRGHEVTVFTVRHRQGEVALPGVTVVTGLKLCRNMDWKILKDCSIDGWHVMNAAYSWIALETGSVVVSVHGNDFLRPYYPVARPGLGRFPGMWRFESRLASIEKFVGERLTPALLRRSLPKARHILANSCYTERIFLEHFPECAGKTSAAMVGVAEEFFNVERPARQANAITQLLTICRLSEPRKNVESVLRALERLKGRFEFRYTVIGDGHLRPGLEALCSELGLGKRVTFAGYLPNEEVRQRLADSDLFILASSVQPESHEGFGIVYLEANACGIPVLAARLAGAVEAVAEGESGFFVIKPSVESLTRALESFMSGRVRFESEACRSFARRFSWQKVVDHSMDFYPKG